MKALSCPDGCKGCESGDPREQGCISINEFYNANVLLERDSSFDMQPKAPKKSPVRILREDEIDGDRIFHVRD